jgi:hypothetical protein
MSRGLWLVILLCCHAAMAATRLEGQTPLSLTGNQTPQRLDLSPHTGR